MPAEAMDQETANVLDGLVETVRLLQKSLSSMEGAMTLLLAQKRPPELGKLTVIEGGQDAG